MASTIRFMINMGKLNLIVYKYLICFFSTQSSMLMCNLKVFFSFLIFVFVFGDSLSILRPPSVFPNRYS